jgi:hypothetical protein
MKNRTFYKGVFWLLTATGIALIITSIAIPIFVPIGVPVGVVCLTASFGMFQSRFSTPPKDEEAQEVQAPPADDGGVHSENINVNIDNSVNVLFMFDRSKSKKKLELPSFKNRNTPRNFI